MGESQYQIPWERKLPNFRRGNAKFREGDYDIYVSCVRLGSKSMLHLKMFGGMWEWSLDLDFLSTRDIWNIFYDDQSKKDNIVWRFFCLIFKTSKTKLLDFPPLWWNPRHFFVVGFYYTSSHRHSSELNLILRALIC